MATRHPISAPDILDKQIHAGKNSVGVLMQSTPANPMEGFGFNTGMFYGNIPLTVVPATIRTTTELPIRIIDAYAIADGANIVGQKVTISKTTLAGVTTALIDIVFAGSPNELIRATIVPLAPATYASLTLAAGDSLVVVTTVLGGGAYVFISFMNV